MPVVAVVATDATPVVLPAASVNLIFLSNVTLIFFALSGAPLAADNARSRSSWVISAVSLAPEMVNVSLPAKSQAADTFVPPAAAPAANATCTPSSAPDTVTLNFAILFAVKSISFSTPVVPTPIVPSNNLIPLKSVPSAIRLISSFKAETSSCNALRSTSSV